MVEGAWIEAGVALGIAVISSVVAYSRSSARADAKFEELERIIEERRLQVVNDSNARKEFIDREIRDIKFSLNKDFTRVETLIGEFRQSIAVLYNDKSDIKVDVALNYLLKTEFYAALERISIQVNGYQVNMEARFNRLEERLK